MIARFEKMKRAITGDRNNRNQELSAGGVKKENARREPAVQRCCRTRFMSSDFPRGSDNKDGVAQEGAPKRRREEIGHPVGGGEGVGREMARRHDRIHENRRGHIEQPRESARDQNKSSVIHVMNVALSHGEVKPVDGNLPVELLIIVLCIYVLVRQIFAQFLIVPDIGATWEMKTMPPSIRCSTRCMRCWIDRFPGWTPKYDYRHQRNRVASFQRLCGNGSRSIIEANFCRIILRGQYSRTCRRSPRRLYPG
jgi:hypothetical protein